MMPCYAPVIYQGCPVVSHSDVAVSRLVCFVVGYTFIRGFFLEALGNRMIRDEKCSQKH